MTDQGNVESEELARLRHRAYSREGTSEDRDRLAVLESALRSVGRREPDEPLDEQVEIAPDPSTEPSDEDDREGVAGRGRLSWRIAALVAVAALLVGGFLGFGLGVRASSEQVASLLQEQTDLGVPGLRIFDRVEAPLDPPDFDIESATGLVAPEVRGLATVDVTEVFIARGPNAFGDLKVCLIASGPSGEQVRCAAEADFIVGQGLALELGSFIVGWWPQTDTLLLAPG
ncbi:hypothetical protein [Pseudolysinimonas sp.]|jgi:hypothetical protein|uniref:hypothetical protein n=1 Tax=Pseudolysinimonas sp. TaxID=2680009 RepID=UPI003785002A